MGLLLMTVALTGISLSVNGGQDILRHAYMQQAMINEARLATRLPYPVSQSTYAAAVSGALGSESLILQQYRESGSPGHYTISALAEMRVAGSSTIITQRIQVY